MKTLISSNNIDNVTAEKVVKFQKKSYDFSKLFSSLENYESDKNNTILSIILPMYNEEKTIRNVLESLPGHKSIEIIVVDDKSTDNSIEEIKKVKEIEEAYTVYGVYDVIAKVRADTMDELKEVVTFNIRRMKGIRSTLTMIVIEGDQH